MRYVVYYPSEPELNPIDREYDSLQAFDARFARSEPHDREDAAADSIRQIWPDAVALKIPVKMGSGLVTMLGIVANARVNATNTTNGEQLRCVAVVRAAGDTAIDRKRVQTQQHFSQVTWKTPVASPHVDSEGRIRLELRATTIPAPIMIDARIGIDAARQLVLRIDLGDDHMSLSFPSPETLETWTNLADAQDMPPESTTGLSESEQAWHVAQIAASKNSAERIDSVTGLVRAVMARERDPFTFLGTCIVSMIERAKELATEARAAV